MIGLFDSTGRVAVVVGGGDKSLVSCRVSLVDKPCPCST
jgi:hypothetical protein